VVGEFRIAGNDPNTAADLETQNRLDLEAETTDVKTPVDIHLPDVDAVTGSVHDRWVTPYEMTGEGQTATPSGGINRPGRRLWRGGTGRRGRGRG
jgi:hypothetical protein